MYSLTVTEARYDKSRFQIWLPFGLLLIGFFLRLALAALTFLNADEVVVYLLSLQPSAQQAYLANFRIPHPPLLVLLLHFWGSLNHSEVFLRLPSVMAGTAFCWVMYRWVELVLDRTAGLIALVLSSFLPPLISLSAEVRQYALLMFFMALSLYLFDQALAKDSLALLLWSAFFLWLALLTHYSALIFAAAHGIYAMIRFWTRPPKWRLIAPWVGGQVLALALAGFLLTTQVPFLGARGLPQRLAERLVPNSMFHPGHDNVAWFVLLASLRLFRYLSWNGVMSGFSLLLFGAGLVLLWKNGPAPAKATLPSWRQLAVLLALPFLINLVTAFARKYPYGGTRHSAFLAVFAVVGMSVALGWLSRKKPWPVFTGLALGLALGNLFPAPSGAYIRPWDQARSLMSKTDSFLAESVPPGSVILTDEEGGLILSYYFCRTNVVPLGLSRPPFSKFPCRDKSVISTAEYFLDAQGLRSTLQSLAAMPEFSLGKKIWFFQAGWDVGRHDMLAQLDQNGCSAPTRFGRNILICELSLPEKR